MVKEKTARWIAYGPVSRSFSVLRYLSHCAPERLRYGNLWARVGRKAVRVSCRPNEDHSGVERRV